MFQRLFCHNYENEMNPQTEVLVSCSPHFSTSLHVSTCRNFSWCFYLRLLLQVSCIIFNVIFCRSILWTHFILVLDRLFDSRFLIFRSAWIFCPAACNGMLYQIWHYQCYLQKTLLTRKKQIYIFLISALAINCYTCIPGPPSNLCISNLNVSNCDNFPGAPPGATFDTCAKFSLEVSFAGQKFSANAMTCWVKVSLRRGYIQNVYI